jgi:hypothetical protein
MAQNIYKFCEIIILSFPAYVGMAGEKNKMAVS